MMAAGVARISAQGQATTRTAKAGGAARRINCQLEGGNSARLAAPRPSSHQATRKVTKAKASVMGRNQRAKASARRSMADLSAKALAVSLPTWPATVCSATRRASSVMAPR